ncbi:hypothetical protein ACEPAF_3090 [Sanghuangporus sanghuang]
MQSKASDSSVTCTRALLHLHIPLLCFHTFHYAAQKACLSHSSRVNQRNNQIDMELDFPRRRIFNATFITPGPGASKPVYRISTTRDWKFFPHKTTIEFVASDDPQDHKVIAQIIWNWPSQDRSYVHFGGHLYALSEFLGCGVGFLNTDSQITFEHETYTWRTYAFEPQLYDSSGRQVVTYKRDPVGLFKPNSISPAGHLRISESIAVNPMARDATFASFFIFMVSRNLHLPWKKHQVTDVSESKTEAVATSVGEQKPNVEDQQVSGDEKDVKAQDAKVGGEGSDGNDDTSLKNEGEGENVLPGAA